MILSESVRQVRKDQQTARLAAKAKAAKTNKDKSADDSDFSEYHAFYEGQGLQIAKKEHNEKITRARQLVRAAKDQLDLARVSGVGITEALTNLTTATATLEALNQDKQAMFGRASSFGISGE